MTGSGMLLLDPFQQIEAAAAGHADVGDEHAGQLAVVQRRQGLVGGTETEHRDALAAEGLLQYPADGTVVVDEPDRFHSSSFFRFVSGSISEKQVCPGRERTSMVPPCCCTKLCAIVSPSPVPFSRPDTSG